MINNICKPSEPDYEAAAELCRLLKEKPHNVNDILNFALDNKQAARTKYEGSYPLSLAIEERTSYDVVAILFRLNPAALKEPINDREETPLHRAIIKRLPFKVLQFLVNETPEIESHVTIYGSTPLHFLCDRKPTEDKLKLFLSKNPKAATKQDAAGRTPLHCVFENNVTLKDIKPLLRTNPAAITARDTYGQTPFHLAFHVRTDFDVFAEMIKMSPSVVGMQDVNGKTPLHLASTDRLKSELLPLLLEASPSAARLQDRRGLTPLHVACCFGLSSAVRCLLEADPYVVKIADIEGRDPLSTVSQLLDNETMEMLRGVHYLFGEDMNPIYVAIIMKKFSDDCWWFGVRLVIDLFPQVTQYFEDMPMAVIPSALSTIGESCKMLTVWKIITNKQDLFE